MSYAIQSKQGIEQNKLFSDDLAIHDWYRFVLSYPPHLVRSYLDRFGLQPHQTVLDPFCGTGTTLVECKKNGIHSIGIEAIPAVQLFAGTKINWDIDATAFLEQAEFIAETTLSQIEQAGKDLRTLPSEGEKLIISNSISPLPLHKALILRDTISGLSDASFKDHFNIAFAKQLVVSFSNLHFGPEVGVSRSRREDAPVVKLWLQQVHKMAYDLLSVRRQKQVASRAVLADARDLRSVLKPDSVDAVITSPPYPNEKDYTRTTRLESVMLGFIRNRSELRVEKQRLVRSNTRNIYKADADEFLIENHPKILKLAAAIEARRIELGKTSGFERQYHRVVKNYFGGMKRHFMELQPILRPGAKLAYVVGDQSSYFRIPIRTAELLAEVASSIGYHVVDIDLFRTRISTATKEQLREEVLLLQWKG